MPAFSPDKPHFFQPLILGFQDKLLIPVSFFKYLKGLECHELTLRSSGGKLWPIKVNGRQFTDGWKEFVQDHDLHVGDFVVFGHQGNFVFDFVVLDESTCEREYPALFPSEEEETKNEETEIEQENVSISTSSGKKVGRQKKGEASSPEPEHPYPNYVIKLSRDNIKKGRLHFPRKFARENGLSGRSYSIILEDEESRCWESKLRYSSAVNRFEIGAGWRDFRIERDLKEGDYRGHLSGKKAEYSRKGRCRFSGFIL